MELDNLDSNEESWNSQPMRITGILTITLSAIVSMLFIYVYTQVDTFQGQIEEELARQGEDFDVEKLMSYIKIFILIVVVPFLLSIVGAALMMNKSNGGWILLIVAHVLAILLLFLLFLSSFSIMFLVLLGGYVALTVFANKHRYKPEENFENYSN